MTDEHTVAIVSFAGAVKREIKRVRKRMARDENQSRFAVRITATGRLHDGDVNLTYAVGHSDYGYEVEGDDLDACVDELMRRDGWKKVHAPVAIGYEKIPSDDTDPSDEALMAS